MAQIRTTVRTEIEDRPGETFVVERVGTTTSGNPRFHAREARNEAGALLETVMGHVEHQYGEAPEKEVLLSSVDRGQVISSGHPSNGRLFVKGADGFRNIDTGQVADPDEFRGGWSPVGWSPE